MNPVFLFFFIWLTVYIIFKLALSEFLIQGNTDGEIYVLFALFIILVFGKGLSGRKNNIRSADLKINTLSISLVNRLLVPILILEVFSEYIYFGTLPLFAADVYSDLNYNDPGKIFGFRHNIFVKANTIFLAGYYFLLFNHQRKSKYLYLFIGISIIPIVYNARSILVSITLVVVMIYCLFNKVTWRFYIGLFVGFFLAAFVFNQIYIYRNINNVHFVQNFDENQTILEGIGAGSKGIYAYITSPLSNLCNNIGKNTFTFLEFRPHVILRGYMTRDMGLFLFGPFEDPSFSIRYDRDYNTCTAFPPWLFSFGLLGFLVVLIPLSFLMRYFYYKSVADPARWLLILIFLNHMIMLSIFSYSLTDMVFYFPMFMSFLLPPFAAKKI